MGAEFEIPIEDIEMALARLREAIQTAGSQLRFAREHKIAHTTLSQVMRRRIDPPPAVLAAIGLRRIVRYEEVPATTPKRRKSAT